jgi:uncharacterized protein
MLFPSFVRRSVTTVLIATCLIIGCVANRPQTTKFYVLTPIESSAVNDNHATPTDPLFIEVTALHLPQYLERPQIVTRSGKNQLVFAEYHQWGGNLRKNMIQILATNLAKLLSTPNVSTIPYRNSVPPDFSVAIDILQFERDPIGQVKLSAKWSLSSGKNRNHLKTEISELIHSTDNPPQGFKETVDAMSALFGELSLIIAKNLQGYTPGVPGS